MIAVVVSFQSPETGETEIAVLFATECRGDAHLKKAIVVAREAEALGYQFVSPNHMVTVCRVLLDHKYVCTPLMNNPSFLMRRRKLDGEWVEEWSADLAIDEKLQRKEVG